MQLLARVRGPRHLAVEDLHAVRRQLLVKLVEPSAPAAAGVAIVGGRAASYEREMNKARETALDELEDWADELGANAIVGIDLDYESFGQANGMIMVSATGTAVIIEDLEAGEYNNG